MVTEQIWWAAYAYGCSVCLVTPNAKLLDGGRLSGKGRPRTDQEVPSYPATKYTAPNVTTKTSVLPRPSLKAYRGWPANR